MHRSRLRVVLIDPPPEAADREVAFGRRRWGGGPSRKRARPFTTLTTLGGGEVLAHQRLDDGDARIHLDIETDDVCAEVDRLTILGAVQRGELGEHDGCVHMRDSAGLTFCVVPVQSEDFEERATVWP